VPAFSPLVVRYALQNHLLNNIPRSYLWVESKISAAIGPCSV
jgi:hypothetical protein